MKAKFRWYDSVFIFLIIYLLVLQIWAIWPFTVDDMFISLRYAKNWTSGIGLLWNQNELPVEGYSNFSFVVLAALALLLKMNPVFVLKITGFLGLVSVCVFVYLISRFWLNTRQALLPCMILLFYKGQILWAVSGLETTVYEACICASVYFAFKGLAYQFYYPKSELKNTVETSVDQAIIQPWNLILSGFFLSMAGLTRPEVPALMLLFFILLVWDSYRIGLKRNFRVLSLFVAPILLVYLPYFIWRLHYYGYLFPNSVYCKGFALESYLLDINYLKLIWPFLLLSVPALIQARDKRPYFLCLPSLLYWILLLHADPIVAFENRLFLPAFVLLLPLSFQGVSVISRLLSKDNETLYYIFYYIISLFLILVIPKMTLVQYQNFSKAPIQGELLRMQVLQWLEEHSEVKDTVVLSDAGLIPFYSSFTFIDSYCLNNLAMAHYKASERYQKFCKEIIKEKPSVIVLTSLSEAGTITYTPADYCLKKMLSNKSAYKKVKIFSTEKQETGYRYELFTDKLMP